MRIIRRIHAPFAVLANVRTKVTKNVIGIIAIAPREYVLITQAVDATKAEAFKTDFRHPPRRKHAKNNPEKRCMPIARQF